MVVGLFKMDKASRDCQYQDFKERRLVLFEESIPRYRF